MAVHARCASIRELLRAVRARRRRSTATRPSPRRRARRGRRPVRRSTAFGTALVPADRVSALAMAHAPRGLHVTCRRRGRARPSRSCCAARASAGRSYAHHVVEVGANARATVVVDHRGALIEVAANVEIVVGDGAAAHGRRVNDCDAGSVQLAPTRAGRPRRHATGTSTSTSAAGRAHRRRRCASPAPAARAELLGVSFAGDGPALRVAAVRRPQPARTARRTCCTRTRCSASRPARSGSATCASARAPPAPTPTRLNRNLLLSDGARADSVPNLEIETGEIAGAGHASATGTIRRPAAVLPAVARHSRGRGQRLVVRGFFADVVGRIGLPDLSSRIMTAIEARLGFTPELRERTEMTSSWRSATCTSPSATARTRPRSSRAST